MAWQWRRHRQRSDARERKLVQENMKLSAYQTSINLCYRAFVRQRLHFTTFGRCGRPVASPAEQQGSAGGGFRKSSGSQGNSFLLPGATVATILMLGALHTRRLYDDKKTEEAKIKGLDLDFHPDVKARFLRLLPLRTISRSWGILTSMEIPCWLRSHLYKAWARAFHSNLEEAQLPLEEYKSLREFFVRKLKEGSRPIDADPYCLVSPVDGIVLRFGKLGGPGAMIEQVKGCSYSAYSLLGANSYLPMVAAGDANEENSEEKNVAMHVAEKSWWTISLASPRVRDSTSSRPLKGLFYCVIYLEPGDYHRVHSPVDWHILARRHFTGNSLRAEAISAIQSGHSSAINLKYLSYNPQLLLVGHLFPTNERATRTIRNLYVENERVVLEGHWKEGYLAMAAIGATMIGSIELFIEPTLRTNNPQKKMLHPEPPEERLYEPEGMLCKKGDEVAAFNMGSTVVLVFQAPVAQSSADCDGPSEFRFSVNRGDKIRMGEALGRWNDL